MADQECEPMVTEVRVQLTKTSPVLAFVSVTLWGSFVIHEIRVLARADGTRAVLMPRRKAANGSWSTIAYPIRDEVRREIEDKVLLAFDQQQATAGSAQSAP